ncbi:MAG: helix-turn-helix domain-containing protein [Candidatus Bathyarchaeota archaeon]|nr:helix-turn-helix domain-containing protein [Candidatus Bathyarchaeota archaeon]
MRRLNLEVSEKELSKVGVEIPPFHKIKSLELLHFLRQDNKEIAAVWKIEFKDPATKIEELLVQDFLFEVQLLEKEKNGVYTIFMRGGPTFASVLNSIGVVNGYLFPPLGIQNGLIKISFLGSAQQVREFLEKLDAKGIRYRITLMGDAQFSPDSPLNQLTDKQREVLISAFKLGYYDIPRRINSDELAKKLNIVNSTLIEHLRKAEQRLLHNILTQRNDFGLNDEKNQTTPHNSQP